MKVYRENCEGTQNMNLSIQSDFTDCLRSAAGEYVMKKSACVAFFSVLIDTTVDISQKDLINEIYQYNIQIQNDENVHPLTVRIYSLGWKKLCNKMPQILQISSLNA